MSTVKVRWVLGALVAAWCVASPVLAQTRPASAAAAAATPRVSAGAGVTMPDDYVIGPDDVLSVVYWKDKELSADVAVRPDGKISLPLVNDLSAAGLTPEQLRVSITAAAAKFVEDPTVSVVVKAINSRKVFVTGQVQKPGVYPLNAPTTIMQLIAMAGGVLEFADSEKILVLRNESGKQVAHPFNYKQVLSRKNLRQNIDLKPGDTIVVP